MSTVQEIEEAIEQLPKEAREQLFASLLARFGTSRTPDVESGDPEFDEALQSVFRDYAPLLKELAK